MAIDKTDTKTDARPAALGVQRIRRIEDIEHIRFQNDVAAVELPIALLGKVRFKNHKRGSSARLTELEKSIANRGFDPTDPVIARIGRKGKWVVVDGGHRITALQRRAGGFWRWLIGPRKGSIYVLLFLTERSAERYRL